MQQTIKIEVTIPINNGEKLKCFKSKYDYYVYYKLEPYGDWIDYELDNNNILREEYDECSNTYTYSFGRFENGKYISVLSFMSEESVLDNIDTEIIETEEE